MTRDALFLAASFVIGVAMVVDGFHLLRHSGVVGTAQKYFSAFELLWVAVCIYLWITARVPATRWLAAAYVVQLPISLGIAFAASPKIFEQEPDDIRAPKSSAYFGALFGVLYALAALFAIVRA